MVQALAPRLSRGCSTVRLWMLFLAFAARPALAQVDPAKGATKGDAPASKKDDSKPAGAPGTKGAAAPGTAAETPEEQGVVDSSQVKKRETTELFKDPRVDKARANTFTALPYPNPRLTDRDVATVQNMAGGGSAPDRGLITRLVDTMTADLTNHANIKAVIDPDPKLNPNSTTVRGLERASATLVSLLNAARANKNEAFLGMYIPLLQTKLPPLLENHLLARIEASIILAMTAGPNTIDLFTKQINDPNQVVWVKLWAARGLTNATNEGKTLIDVVKGTAAASALVGFLTKEPNAPWPVKVRVFEALGSLRLFSTTGPQGKPDVPAAALRHVSDPGMKVDARAWAAWSLGMVPIPTSVPQYNFGLETYLVGRLAADIGDKIGAEFDDHETDFTKQSEYARYLTGLLLYQVYPALTGATDVRESGLLNMRHPALAAAQPVLKGLDEQIKNLGRAAIELLNAGGVETKKKRAVVAERVAELNTFLDKNRPTDTQLTPGGPKFPVAPAQVAGGPAPAK